MDTSTPTRAKHFLTVVGAVVPGITESDLAPRRGNVTIYRSGSDGHSIEKPCGAVKSVNSAELKEAQKAAGFITQ